MSNQNLHQFYTLIQNSQELQVQLGAAETPETFAETAVRLGEENGYSFNTEDVNAFISQQASRANAELSDADLETVAGGKGRTCPLGSQSFTLIIIECGVSIC
ncbi:Nif11-like leader peptide family RiPP precursor [Aliinostoc sp. HNIBRCY26]|uniref:Nif11-like leader peptide family RiPP precursor n=1 Tax=Aliinostoc sp. HNIBRCY26 TaxID=3418997 RepID=UPI003D046162